MNNVGDHKLRNSMSRGLHSSPRWWSRFLKTRRGYDESSDLQGPNDYQGPNDFHELTRNVHEPSNVDEPGDPVQLQEPSGVAPPIEIEYPIQCPRLWALIIGINAYSSKTPLRGAVPDANEMEQYLLNPLRVPEGQIHNLRDKGATRQAIIAAFEGLRDNVKIKYQDPILIYYAGHGGEIPKANTQALVPVDYKPGVIYPIPDRTVAALINGISKEHGNNITVIFDCCHSGSGTRGDGDTEESLVRSCELSPNDYPDGLDADVLKRNSGDHPEREAAMKPGARGGLHWAKGFATKDTNSHVLLAACRATEQAREDKETPQMFHGRFTTALLELLRGITQPDQFTYTDVLSKMPRIDGQNPQCEGCHKSRILFDSKIRPPTRVSYRVNRTTAKSAQQYILDGGKAHGVTDGAQFTLYQSTAAAQAEEEPLGVFIAKGDNILPFTSLLEPKAGRDIPAFSNPAIAVQTRAGASHDLYVYAPLGGGKYGSAFRAVAEEMYTAGEGHPIKFVERAERSRAAYELVASEFEKGKLCLNVLETRATKYGFKRLPHAIDGSDAQELYRVLSAASHYHFHLNLYHPNNLIDNSIKIEFFQVEDKNGAGVYFPAGKNLHRAGKIECVVDVDSDPKYGMKVTNETPRPLHLYCFYFDHSDLSIDPLSELDPAGKTVHQKDYLLEQGTTFEMGCGRSNIPPLECQFPAGLDVTIGFLKFYFTSEVVDLSHVPQGSPFGSAVGRKLVRSTPRLRPVLGTVVIPVILKRK